MGERGRERERDGGVSDSMQPRVNLRDVVPTMKSFSDMAGMYLHTHARTHSMRPWP